MNLSFKAQQKRQQIRHIADILSDLFTIPSPKRQSVAAMKSESRERFFAHQITERFWTQSSSPLHPWLKKHNVSYNKNELPNYTEGGAGRVYFCGDFVVKMSTNSVEANVANMVKGRTDLPTAIIDVTYLDKGVYAILQPYVITDVPREIRKAADYLTMIVDDYPEMEGYPDTVSEQKRICSEILDNYNGDKSLLPHMMMMLGLLISLYQATGYKHTDAGPSNIATYKGKVVIPDLGPHEDGDYDASKALSQIDKNRSKIGLNPYKTI